MHVCIVFKHACKNYFSWNIARITSGPVFSSIKAYKPTHPCVYVTSVRRPYIHNLNFLPLEVVGRGSETQLQVGGNLNLSNIL